MLSFKVESDHVTHSLTPNPQGAGVASRTLTQPRGLTPKVLEEVAVAGFPRNASAIAWHLLFLPVTVVPLFRGVLDFLFFLCNISEIYTCLKLTHILSSPTPPLPRET